MLCKLNSPANLAGVATHETEMYRKRVLGSLNTFTTITLSIFVAVYFISSSCLQKSRGSLLADSRANVAILWILLFAHAVRSQPVIDDLCHPKASYIRGWLRHCGD